MTPINLSFGMESSSCLWNKIFEGFDQDSILTTRFEGNSPESIELLYRFGALIRRQHKDCKVEPRNYGIIIKRQISEDDKEFIDEWMKLMKNLKNEILKIQFKN